ncbi:TetR/AcrR family transcriptional regulator [Nocardioides sp. YIM 152315]|uniref:TetR/AcrR family transcriptional regulator n=1 Tax=Nocardioides sp. YIM 152315 TaxID=3031760 RepID=UPI0023DAF586|nr:TetR/AcrR family transcriptional regulator [Nocardioides sp. YIM 152315]MDF1606289.1 helix-turn-helix domain containing protein [Nocardioides sp. YIM 152315]
MPKDGSTNRARILDAAEQLVIDHGYAATSVDRVLEAAGTSKGAFFHHFDSKLALARALTERYVAADLDQLNAGLDATADVADPAERVIAFLRYYEDRGDEIMGAQSNCLYVAVLTERQLLDAGTADLVRGAVQAWRAEIARLLSAAADGRATDLGDVEDLADHVFTTFEGAFLLCRATGSPQHMRAQLGVLRRLVGAALGVDDRDAARST